MLDYSISTPSLEELGKIYDHMDVVQLKEMEEIYKSLDARERLVQQEIDQAILNTYNSRMEFKAKLGLF